MSSRLPETRIVVFDGFCFLFINWARFLSSHNQNPSFRFVPMQSGEGSDISLRTRNRRQRSDNFSGTRPWHVLYRVYRRNSHRHGARSSVATVQHCGRNSAPMAGWPLPRSLAESISVVRQPYHVLPTAMTLVGRAGLSNYSDIKRGQFLK